MLPRRLSSPDMEHIHLQNPGQSTRGLSTRDGMDIHASRRGYPRELAWISMRVGVDIHAGGMDCPRVQVAASRALGMHCLPFCPWECHSESNALGIPLEPRVSVSSKANNHGCRTSTILLNETPPFPPWQCHSEESFVSALGIILPIPPDRTSFRFASIGMEIPLSTPGRVDIPISTRGGMDLPISTPGRVDIPMSTRRGVDIHGRRGVCKCMVVIVDKVQLIRKVNSNYFW